MLKITEKNINKKVYKISVKEYDLYIINKNLTEIEKNKIKDNIMKVVHK